MFLYLVKILVDIGYFGFGFVYVEMVSCDIGFDLCVVVVKVYGDI